jgi:hypothetical protein
VDERKQNKIAVTANREKRRLEIFRTDGKAISAGALGEK